MTGAGPSRIVNADFNNDGKLDLAVVHPTSNSGGFGNTVSVHLGDGTGAFASPGTSFTTGGSNTGLASGDFNEDGRADLVIGALDSQRVFVHLGNGDGTFTQIGSVFVGVATDLTTADFNGDGHLDVATSRHSAGAVAVLLGTGTGSFNSPVSFSVGTNPRDILTGDFNGDSAIDLAVVNSGSDNVSILLGDGMGSFGAANSFSVGDLPLYGTVSDFDGDGNLDLATANRNVGTVSVLFGDGSGSFSSPLNLVVQAQPGLQDVQAADFNGDGKPDLAVVSDFGRVSVLLNTTNTPPVITSAATVNAAENQTSVIDVQSSDPDGETEGGGGLTYSLTGGADQALFSIDTNSGVLTFNVAADFENPADANTDNVYDVQVTVTDTGLLTGVQNLAVTVTNVNEAPTVANPIADVTANEDAPDDVIDLSNLFDDVDASDTLTLSVSGNTNTSLVTTSIVGSDLVLDYQADQNGIAVITVRSTDAGGLFAEDTLTVTVLSAADQLNNLVADVGGLGLKGGNTNALISKLENAIAKLDAGKTTAGVNKIHAFINQVNAFVNSGKLPQTEASVLIDAANAAITSAGLGGAALVMDGTSTGGDPVSAQPVSNIGDLVVDTLKISLVDTNDGVSADEQAALQAAIDSLNVSLSPYGVALVEVASAADADVRVEIAAVSAGGGAADGLLGYAVAGEITILSGWDWYTGADVNAIAAGQYDFRTVVTHELGHSVGLDHSGDINSVMHDTLGTNVTRHTLTDQDLSLIAGHAEAPAALRAAGWSNSEPHAPREQVFTDWHQTWFSNQMVDKRLTDERRPIERIDGADEIMNRWTGPGEAAQRRIAVNDYMPANGLVVYDDWERDILTGSSSIDSFVENLDGEGPGRFTDLVDKLFAGDLDFILSN
ncbi:MAG: VCBS repeat-containing protein [Planctomycetes bacterium]|nr:VCBS repeat-containing protein [Planctomycetota bacterium]